MEGDLTPYLTLESNEYQSYILRFVLNVVQKLYDLLRAGSLKDPIGSQGLQSLSVSGPRFSQIIEGCILGSLSLFWTGGIFGGSKKSIYHCKEVIQYLCEITTLRNCVLIFLIDSKWALNFPFRKLSLNSMYKTY